MSGSINNYANSGYYQMSNLTGGQSGSTSSGTPATNLTQSLVSALSGTSASGTGSSDAYLLNLSPAAQAYLKSSGTSGTTAPSLSSFLSGGGSASASNVQGGSSSFVLSQQQQTAITNIIAKYKNAPYTQDTFNQIQNDLNSAGLGANTLSQMDKARSFNPALILINALNGGAATSSDTGQASDSEEQSKSSSYMQGILSQWQNVSGNSGKTPATSPSGSAQSASAVTAVTSGAGA